MREKLPIYTFLYFFSFIFFTGVFHTAANAQTSDGSLLSNIEEGSSNLKKDESPTPTIYFAQKIEGIIIKEEEIPTETPSPTEKPEVKEKASPTTGKPTPTIVITQAPTGIPPTDTPTPTPIPTAQPTEEPATNETPTPVEEVDLESLFTQFSNEYSVDKDLLRRIAACESGFRADAMGAGGVYVGMYQFSENTWISNRQAMGHDSNPELRKNAGESIRTAAFMISRGGQGAWPNCN